MIKIIAQLLSSFLGGQPKIVADNQNIHDGCLADNQHFEPYFQPCTVQHSISLGLVIFSH